jgi:hypothetical protein
MSSTPQVEYRRLGKSGLRVSVPILGAMSLGSSKWLPWVLDEAEVCDCQMHAVLAMLSCFYHISGTSYPQGCLGQGRDHLGHG